MVTAVTKRNLLLFTVVTKKDENASYVPSCNKEKYFVHCYIKENNLLCSLLL